MRRRSWLIFALCLLVGCTANSYDSHPRPRPTPTPQPPKPTPPKPTPPKPTPPVVDNGISQAAFEAIQPGQSSIDVVKVLGTPYRTSTVDGQLVYVYRLHGGLFGEVWFGANGTVTHRGVV